MPKIRRGRSPSMDCSRSYPYPSSSINMEMPKPKLGSADEMKEWDDTSCPICMETPHNSVLLKCSSYDMGCRPYMCNTSYRHSNCLDQFCKSFDSNLSSAILEEIPLTGTASGDRKVQSEPGNPSQCGSQLQPKLVCPLCRGGIYGYMVSQPARRYMNCKPRSCSSETCEFQGTYPELRKHARLEHPSVRPSEVDPSRQCDWLRMEQERDIEDLFTTINENSGAEFSRETIRSGGFADLMSFFSYEIFSSIEDANRVSSLITDSRPRMPLDDGRSGTMHMVSNNTQTNQSARWRSSLPSTHQPERIHRGRWGGDIQDLLTTINENSGAEFSRDTILSGGFADMMSLVLYEIFSSIEDVNRMSSLITDSRPRMPLDDRRRTRHRVSNNTQTNQSARWRSSLPSTHQPERIHRGRWGTNLSSSRNLEANRTARWRANIPPSRMSRSVHNQNYYRDLSPGFRTSSTRMTRGSQVSQTNSRSNNSSSRRIPGQRLRWRDQRWSTFDGLP